MKPRSAGILLHITSLSNRFPVGDLGPAARAFADFMKKSGLRWWEMLPIGPAGGENSPYDSSSAFGGNPLLISPEGLVEQGLLAKKDITAAGIKNLDHVNFASAAKLKIRLLTKAYKNFTNQSDAQQKLNSFARAQALWLDDWALFSAIKANEGTADWTQWDSDLRTRKPKAMQAAKKYFANAIRYHQFVQWQFALQWQALRMYCNKKGIALIGDLPLFVSHQSADVWAHPDIFKLNTKGKPTVVAGVPPDYFSSAGQLWGLPVYRWDVLKKQGYAWWLERLKINLQRFDMLRLDHFIGFVRTYEVPARARTARKGNYRSAAGADFFKQVAKTFKSMPFIADDLGVVTPKVIALRDKLKLLGMKILQFELEATLKVHARPPKKISRQTVVYTGTHDNDTSKGWYEKLPAQQRKILSAQLHTRDSDFTWAMIRLALSAKSELAIIPLQDFLGLGSKARMNVPGYAHGNWQWRVKKNVLTSNLAHRIRKLTLTAKRK